MMVKQLMGIALAVALGMGGAWLAVRYTAVSPPAVTAIAASDLPAGGDFTLQTLQGDVKLADLRGKVVVVYFGYTACPDICPTSMATLKGALNQLTASELAQVQGLLISVDPERDTLAHVQEYANYFHPNIRGVTGSPVVLQEVAQRYRAFYRKVPMAGSAMAYSIDHSAILYVVDKQGKLRELVQHATPPAELAAAIRRYL